jgi:UDP-glucose 4-epimerase
VRIAVTGSGGQIGSKLIASFTGADEVQGFDLHASARSTALDVAASEAIAVLKGYDVIYHLAAAISVPESVENPSLYVRANVLGTVNVLEAARRGAGRVVFVSTAAVYGEPQSVPIPESHPTHPTSPYGLTKLAGEEFARLFGQLYGLDVSVVRPFNVYSEDLKPDNPYAGVIAIFLRAAAARRPLTVHGDGGQTRDFVHVSDVVQLLRLLGDRRGTGQVYNCGTGIGTSVLELARMVRDRFGPTVEIVHGPSRVGDIRHGVADISRARAIGYRPRVRLAEWIGETGVGSGA